MVRKSGQFTGNAFQGKGGGETKKLAKMRSSFFLIN